MFSRVVAVASASVAAVGIVTAAAVAVRVVVPIRPPAPPRGRIEPAKPPDWTKIKTTRGIISGGNSHCLYWFEPNPAPGVEFTDLIASGDVQTLKECANSRRWNKDEWGKRIADNKSFWDCWLGCAKKDRMKVPGRVAAQHNRLEMLKLLHAHGVLVEDEMLLKIARDNNFSEIAKWLLEVQPLAAVPEE